MNPFSRGFYRLLAVFTMTLGLVTCAGTSTQLTGASDETLQNASATPTAKRAEKGISGWSLKARSFNLENDKLRYSIQGQYPEIQPVTGERALTFNREIRLRIARQYRRFTAPNLEELRRRIRDMPEIPIFDTAEFDYEILFASERFLSIRFHDTTYSFPKVHDVEAFFTLNYDLSTGRILRIDSVFKPERNFYPGLVELCAKGFRAQGISLYYEDGSLEPSAYKFILAYLRRHAEWNITHEGLVINFDQCTIPDCGHGKLSVTIPYHDLKNMLNTRILHSLSN